jgi:hypothetical protein
MAEKKPNEKKPAAKKRAVKPAAKGASPARVKNLEERIDHIVAVLSNRLNFDVEAEPVDIIKSGAESKGESENEGE